ncbi:MAG: hypothetical protein GY884_18820 [Proteobacteria bacterium]|nr:hypothetical protein [Pseudomonadota bacterium]
MPEEEPNPGLSRSCVHRTRRPLLCRSEASMRMWTTLYVLLSGCRTEPHGTDGVTEPPIEGDTAVQDSEDTSTPTDADGDGWAVEEDCDDTDASVHPDADEACNGVDDDCDDQIDEGFSAPWCMPSPAESCTLWETPRTRPSPLVHLDFEDEGAPESNLGSLGPDELVLGSAQSSAESGAIGQGRRFDASGDGTHDHLLFTANEALEVETFTVAAWVYPTTYGDRGTLVNMLWDSAPSGFALDVSWGFLSLRLGDGTTVPTVSVPVAIDTWSHVAAAWDGDVVTLYVDGELRAREHVDEAFEGVTHYPAHMVVGAYQNPAHYAFDGVLDELMLFDEALAPAQVADLLVASHTRFEGAAQLADHGPLGLDADGELESVCGPMGDAWSRTGDTQAIALPEHPAVGPAAGLGVHAWVRPDAEADAVIAQVEGAWSLRQAGADVHWQAWCADGSVASALAEDVLAAGVWAEVDATLTNGHAQVWVDGTMRVDERVGCFESESGDGVLHLGGAADGSAGFAGALDEIEVRSVPRDVATLSTTVTQGTWRATDNAAQTTALVGRTGGDLEGDLEQLTQDDEGQPCFHLQAATRESCAHATGVAEASPGLQGPLTLSARVRPGQAIEQVVFGVDGGPGLWLEEDGWAARWGTAEVTGGPIPQDRWTPVAVAVDHDELRLFVDGVLVGSAAHDGDALATERFSLGGETLQWSSSDAIWVEEATVQGFAWTSSHALSRHAGWRTESHPRLSSSDAMLAVGSYDMPTAAATYVAAWKAGDLDPTDEELTAYSRSHAAWTCAEAAWETGETDEAFELALSLLENVDHGTWDWSWLQGRSLFWYALAYDRVAALLAELEDADPHTWSPRHALLRRRWASTLHHIGITGGVHDDPTYVDHGYLHASPGWLGANSRLMSVGGSGHMALSMPALYDPDFGSSAATLQLSVDDLFYDRAAGGEAAGRYLPAYLHESGLFSEGHGYQSDVFYGLTPFLIDWWQLGGEDHITVGPVREMYEANVAAMLPTGHVWPYATGWLSTQVHNDLMAEFVPDSADLWRWFHARQNLLESGLDEPEWTSAALGDEALLLRSGWDEDALWLGLKGRTQPCPSSHCQADQMSMMLVSHGAWLLIDPGDGRSYRGTPADGQELWLQGAQGHNNVLIDGAGPGLTKTQDDLDDPAALVASLWSDRADYGRMEGTVGDGVTSGGGDHTRHLWLVDDAFFVVLDELEAASEATFDQQFHLGASTTSGAGTLVRAGQDFSWSGTNDDGIDVDLEVVQLAPAGVVTLTSRSDGGTNFRSPEVWDHTYVRARQDGTSATYFTLLLTGTATDPTPIASVLQEDASVRLAHVEFDDGRVIEVGHNATGGLQAVGSVDTDGVLVGTDGASWVFMAEGSQVELDSDLGAWADCTLDALELELDEDLSGTVAWEASSCALTVAWPGDEPAAVWVDGVETTAWSHEGGAVTLDPAPEREFYVSR